MSIPYNGPMYLILLFILLIPLMIGLLREKRYLVYQNIVTLVMLYFIFGGSNWHQGIAIIGYVIWQWLLIYGYFTYRQKANNSYVFYGVILLSLMPLLLSKTLPLLTAHSSLLGFLGISYLTFKAVQMAMDIRDGLMKKFSSRSFLEFMLFFPTISSGPIDRYRRFEKELYVPPTRDKYLTMFDKGIFMLVMGCLYKFIIAYYLNTYVVEYMQKTAILNGFFSLNTVAYMYSYSLYLFFDFAGYSLFAVGTSYLMGYQIPINFNKPFASPNIKEFWNRWHMSLSTWFRDYVFMRLVFTLIKKKVFKSKIVISNISYMALFLLMGVWHGLTWYYIAYGVFHGVAIIVNDAWLRYKKKNQKLPSNWFTYGLAIFITFNTVCFSFLIFSGILDTMFFK
ncbi:D-alanyl-lipoteichoic acid biosynthesis protein DltB [Brochothrix campestris]|uniref:Teichoic acid D-alanyltransferase n=1 Tax=Brochothrix campestris FSL F6-1037 TaxID=1265861 RepID=W7CR61_9LIST|nr:D-alanyl-lipoteichoic acid biosynthesis protein DltB [Brochothrix campestris]EUJ39552.1 MBOAT family protein [Brochothrix campestris FSL F6-1037]